MAEATEAVEAVEAVETVEAVEAFGVEALTVTPTLPHRSPENFSTSAPKVSRKCVEAQGREELALDVGCGAVFLDFG